MTRIATAAIVLAAFTTFGYAQSSDKTYRPGLGEFMTMTQLRHAKLWFAGKQGNWDLAAYQIDEIREGFEDASRLHPTFEKIPVSEMIKSIIEPRIGQHCECRRGEGQYEIYSRLRRTHQRLQ